MGGSEIMRGGVWPYKWNDELILKYCSIHVGWDTSPPITVFSCREAQLHVFHSEQGPDYKV